MLRQLPALRCTISVLVPLQQPLHHLTNRLSNYYPHSTLNMTGQSSLTSFFTSPSSKKSASTLVGTSPSSAVVHSTKKRPATDSSSSKSDAATDDKELQELTSDDAASSSKRSKVDTSSSSALPKSDDAAAAEVIAANDDEIDPAAIEFAELEKAIPPAWRPILKNEFAKPYWSKLKKHLVSDESAGKKIYPPKQYIFRALQVSKPSDIKVVIVGQDPYHGAGQAEGLCFSVAPGIPAPSSLQNIYKEIKSCYPEFNKPKHGHLLKWSQQGVFLLNTALTVRAGEANSHQPFGWTDFTDAVIRAVNANTTGVVWLLWGAHAQKKATLIDAKKHHVLKTSHPSGLSANRGFIGSRCFAECNKLLEKDSKQPIDWQV